MQNIEEFDKTVDKSVWCETFEMRSYRENLVEKKRAIVNGDSICISMSSNLPLDRLAAPRKFGGEEIFTEAEREAGLQYKIICDCIQGRYYANGELTNASSQSNASAVIKKIAIEDQLTKEQVQVVQRIVVYHEINPITSSEYKHFHRYSGFIKRTFECLAEAMQYDNIQKAIDRRRLNARVPA